MNSNLKYIFFVILTFFINVAHTHDNHSDIPCASVIGKNNYGMGKDTGLVFHFPTHTTSNKDILKLKDGELYIGIKVNIKGSDLQFTQNYNVAYTKSGSNLKGVNYWDFKKISDESLKKLGEFPQCKGTFLGASSK